MNNKISLLKETFNKKRKEISRERLITINDDIITKFIYNTNSIDGNILSFDDTKNLLEKGEYSKEIDINYYYQIKDQENAIGFLLNEVNKNTKISKKFIENVNDITLYNTNKDIAGKFKSDDFVETQEIIDNYNSNKELDFFDKIVKLYVDFIRISPFVKGNNQCALYIMNLELMKNGCPLIFIDKNDLDEYKTYIEKAILNKDYKEIRNFIYERIEATINFYIES